MTTNLKPRPVWARCLERTRRNTRPMDPPTEAEQRDAIRVLEEAYGLGMFTPDALLEEAERIFEESNQ